ncbi:MAG TPA: hypothetical protein VD788_08585 [Candidatus Polarisedimenticolaceae bacterium]|nr:hypothetical protein [Candidatus Polarisedimenticolaceae bacterium]
MNRSASLLCIAALSLASRAGETSSTVARTAEFAELKLGESDGVALSERGALFPAPRPVRLVADRLPGQPDQVWSMIAGPAGRLYLGTGPGGKVLEISPEGEASVFYSTGDLLVTALTFDRSGNLIVGTSPGGMLHRVAPDGSGSLWGETGERYVWSLALGTDGRVYAGTGERGTVLRLGADGTAEPFFDSDEAHIVSLLAAPGGGLFAGGAGRGLLYEIDDEGHGIVLFESELPQVSALALDADGRLVVALVAPPEREEPPPALELRLPDGVEVGRTADGLGGLEEGSGPLLRGVIEGISEPAPSDGRRVRGQLVRLTDGVHGTEVWRSSDEAVYSLLSTGDGVLFGTGEPARVYRLTADGDVALIATLAEAQATVLLESNRSAVLATSNPATAYRLEPRSSQPAVFVSHPIDAGASARWGAVRWEAAGTIEIYTRTGNSRDPDGTWSGWSPALTDPERSRVVNPDGRYLQWRARFVPESTGDMRLRGVRVHYETYNRPPELKEFRPEGGGHSFAGKAEFRCSVRDPDGDPVTVSLEIRPRGETDWRAAGGGEAAGDRPRPEWTEVELAWETAAIDEGRYEIRAIASDQTANAPDESGSVTGPTIGVVIDRSPPAYEIDARAGGGVAITLRDALSEIRRLELVRDGRAAYRVRPQDGVCDSTTERFELQRPEAGAALRGFDAAGNRVDIPLPP